jgi:DNA-binding HxlR family transcriptional regulator
LALGRKYWHGIDCPVERFLAVMRDKWMVLIIRDLVEGPKRFNELKRTLPGITSKTLSERLSALVEEDIVTRTVYNEVPVKVEYSLTKKGKELNHVLEPIRDWAERWLPLETYQKVRSSPKRKSSN